MVLGIDYSNEYTQISYFGENMEKPESISTIIDEQRYLIPTVVCKKKGSEDWYIGEDAIYRASLNEGFLIKNLSGGLTGGSVGIIEGKEYTYSHIFSIFLKLLIEMVKDEAKVSEISAIIFTMDEADKTIIDIIKEITLEMGYKKEDIRVISHMESFSYYVLNQQKALWNNDVVLFDFNKNNFKYYRMSVNRRILPNTISIINEDLSDLISIKMLNTEEGMNLADEKFFNIIRQKVNAQIVSSVYLLGVGFTSQWYDKSISLLCNKRKVFQGQNLFSQGACYSLHNQGAPMEECLLLCKGRTLANVSMVIEHQGKSRNLLLSKAGENWYEAGAKIECILDDIRNIQLIISSPISKTSRNISIELEGFPYRPNKTTRIELKIIYQNDSQFTVAVKDKGFGELFKSSGKIIKQTVNVDQYL